jgi:hypothetical protein
MLFKVFMKLFFEMVQDANPLEVKTNECWQRVVLSGTTQACLHSLPLLLEFFCIKFNELTKDLKDKIQEIDEFPDDMIDELYNQVAKDGKSSKRNISKKKQSKVIAPAYKK